MGKKLNVVVGFTGRSNHPVVCLYDIETHRGAGVDLYFEDLDQLETLCAQILEQLKAVRTP